MKVNGFDRLMSYVILAPAKKQTTSYSLHEMQ